MLLKGIHACIMLKMVVGEHLYNKLNLLFLVLPLLIGTEELSRLTIPVKLLFVFAKLYISHDEWTAKLHKK